MTILRRASERGKELPEKLKQALEIQAGLIQPDGKLAELEAYHLNQRDEGTNLDDASTGRNGLLRPIAFAGNQRDEVRDLHDVAGAIQAQPGMKQQTFIAAGFPQGRAARPEGLDTRRNAPQP